MARDRLETIEGHAAHAATVTETSPRPRGREAGAGRYRTGERMGPFLLREKLGEGGMGLVFAAVDVESSRKVAVKVLPAARGSAQEAELRFEREANALASLDHPGIVRYVAHGTSEGGEPYLAMEWLDGEDLAR